MFIIITVRLLEISCFLSHLVSQLTLINNFWNQNIFFRKNHNPRPRSIYMAVPLEYYANIPFACGQYTRIFSRGALNCMDVLYCPPPT
jgi:hypothetical protein